VTSGDLSAYRRLPARQRRAVRRAARRGGRAPSHSAPAGPLLAFARRRQRRARRVLVLAVVLILGSAGAAAWLFLRSGPGLLLATPAAGLLVGGVAGVVSEKRLRRAEEAEALAERQVRGVPAEHQVRGVPTGPAAPATGTPPAGGSAPVHPVDGDAARQRLARILSGRPRAEGEASSGHPWD
jgi:hypothetical protein